MKSEPTPWEAGRYLIGLHRPEQVRSTRIPTTDKVRPILQGRRNVVPTDWVRTVNQGGEAGYPTLSPEKGGRSRIKPGTCCGTASGAFTVKRYSRTHPTSRAGSTPARCHLPQSPATARRGVRSIRRNSALRHFYTYQGSSMTMTVAMLGGPPYKWPHGEKEFPHDIGCGVSTQASWASISELSKNAWVEPGWKDVVRDNWHALLRALRCAPRWPEDADYLKDGETLDHWSVKRLMRQADELHVGAVHAHNWQAANLARRLRDQRKKPHTEKLTPEEWLELRDQLQQFTIPFSAWTRNIERERWGEFYEFLTQGATSADVSVDDKSLPNLEPRQAGAVLWYLNEVLGVDVHDLRCQPCPMCGAFRDADDMTSCEHCGVHTCCECMQCQIGWCDEHDACARCCAGEEHEDE